MAGQLLFTAGHLVISLVLIGGPQLIGVANNVPRHRRLRGTLSCRLIYIFLSVCVWCVCVCVERERDMYLSRQLRELSQIAL